MVNYKICTLAHHTIGTYYRAVKSQSYRSNIVDLITLFRYISSNEKLICIN